MKKGIVVAIVIVFLAVVGGVVIYFSQNNQNTSTGSEVTESSSIDSQAGNSSNNTKKSYTLSEVSTRNTKNECWLVINNKVYDVTQYPNSHPGGASLVLQNCGKDATQAFATKGGEGEPHSASARSLLNKYYIGDLAR